MTRLGDRHLGTAGGSLREGGTPIAVEIRLAQDAHLASVQHTAWMLLNVLSRLDGAVRVIRFNCPANVAPIDRISPLVPRRSNLSSALLEAAQGIGTPSDGFVPVEPSNGQCSDAVIAVGFDNFPGATFCAVGDGLSGGLFTRPIQRPTKPSDLTIGPYLAASLAAGEIFRMVRLIDYSPERQLFLTASNYSHSPEPTWTTLHCPSELHSVLLAGVGAVGTTTLHCLYPLALKGTIQVADNDTKGIEDTNLARYSLFNSAAIGKQKASHAAESMRDAKFRVLPHDGGFDHFFTGTNKPNIVLSAVDINSSRHGLQEQYAPLFLSASTLNLRTEILRCGPPSVGACLACFNPLQQNQRTEEDIRALLQEQPQVMARLSKKLHLDPSEVVAWIRHRKCSETGERLVEELRTDDGSVPAFAVGFVSVLAGTFLAAELLKTLSGYAGPLNDELNRAVFQFQNPSAATNRVQHYPRDNRCTACEPQNAAAKIWKQRFEQFAKYSAVYRVPGRKS